MILVNKFLGINLYAISVKPFVELIWSFKVRFLSLDKRFNIEVDENRIELFENQSLYLANSPYFPLKSMCTFKIRELTRTNIYAVMCSLPINLFIQYIFVLLSIWYFILLVFNFYYFFKWLNRFRISAELDFIKSYLAIGLPILNTKQKYINRDFFNPNKCNNLSHLYSKYKLTPCKKCDLNLKNFTSNFLNSDFIFLIRIISSNSDHLLIQKILIYYWKVFNDIFLSD